MSPAVVVVACVLIAAGVADAGMSFVAIATTGAAEAAERAGPAFAPITSASIPGTITRNGKSIFGTAAMSGVRRAEDIESAAIARWTTRKSVHQYPKDNTKPSPMASPNHSTPIGLLAE